MNKPEAAQVLAVMAAPFPWDVTDDQAEVWYQAALAVVSLDVGLEVAVRLVETEERFPTPARFNSERKAVDRERYEARRALEAASGQRSIPAIPLTLDERAGWIQEMRQMLAPFGRRGTRGHDHKGPEPCPVCGGIAPDALARMSPAEQDIATTTLRRRADERRRGPR